MKRKIFVMLLVLVTVLVIIANQYFRIEYHMSLFRYLLNNQELTQEDREFLKAHGPIVYAADNNAPPLRFYDRNAEQYRGIVIDYLQALAIELETEIVFEPMVWEEALSALRRGESDICDMYPSKERSEVFLFSDPVYYQRGIVLVNKDNVSINRVKDLSGKRVGVQAGDYVHEFLKNNVEDIEYVFGKDYESNLAKLVSGQVDAIVGDEPVISYFLSYYNLTEDYRVIDEALYELPSVFSLHKDNKQLQEIINKGIFKLNRTDIMLKIQQKWFGISTPIGSDQDIPKITFMVVAASFTAAIIFMLIIMWNLELKKAVDEQTKALQESRNNLQTIIDGINQMIVVISEKHMILSANKLFYRFFEITENREFPYAYPGVYENIKRIIKNEQKSAELLIKGRTCLVSSYKIHYDDRDELSYLLMIEDVTDKKVNEARLLQENKMAAVGQLATGVAHEIRNPLGLIRNYAFVMKKSNNKQEVVEKSIGVIEESVDKASMIIDNLLNFSRISNEVVVSVSLKPFIEKIVELNEKMFTRNKVICQLILEDVQMDIKEESLKHILINLINNAVDAMQSGGRLTIWLYENQQGTMIHVIDNGQGMNDETLTRLYDPFFTTKPVGQGTGLGLYIVFNELEKINGKISVVSKVKKGTTFKVVLVNEKNR